MKGVILAGGSGTRLYPLTAIVNKHLLTVGKYPMIHYGIDKLRQAGITEILLVISKQSPGLYTQFLGSGRDWGIDITFKVQEEASGIAHALARAEGFIGRNEKFVLLLGDNLFEDSLEPYVQRFKQQPEGGKVLLKEVPDPRRYGVPILEGDRIKAIEEKPANPQSDYCVTGIYMYDHSVFDIVRNIEPSHRGELEITDVNNVYAAQNMLSYDILHGWWMDAGTFESLHEAGSIMLKRDRDE